MNQSYLAQSVATASPAQLVLMLFDGALGRIARAEKGLRSGVTGDVIKACADLTRAQAIVTELQLSLDRTRGGEIASNLDALYTYCLEQLTVANRGRDTAPLAIVTKVLGDLRDAWNTACCGAPVAG
jgi:flagellar secretion chaperone FliS